MDQESFQIFTVNKVKNKSRPRGPPHGRPRALGTQARSLFELSYLTYGQRIERIQSPGLSSQFNSW